MKAFVPLADGFEEIEAITIIDVLRRAGVEVDIVTLASMHVKGSHGVIVHADLFISNVNAGDYDLAVLPGGMPGSRNLQKNPTVIEIVRHLHEEDKIVAAICAAPLALQEAGVLTEDQFTMHPNVMNEVPLACTNDRVKVFGNVITGQASGAALTFALAIVERLFGAEKVAELNESILAAL